MKKNTRSIAGRALMGAAAGIQMLTMFLIFYATPQDLEKFHLVAIETLLALILFALGDIIATLTKGISTVEKTEAVVHVQTHRGLDGVSGNPDVADTDLQSRASPKS